MIRLFLTRHTYQERQTLGELLVLRDDKPLTRLVTLELPWLENRRNVSCIPAGEYIAFPRFSEKFGRHLRVMKNPEEDVPGRSWILIHAGNYNRDTLGCILVGEDFMDIDGDRVVDVVRSRAALEKLTGLIQGTVPLTIYGRP